MSYSQADLREIYHRTSGYCHVCGGKLALTNYGSAGRKGAWEVEHSNAKANGGSDRANNRYPAHIVCNRSKGTRSTRSARAEFGRTRAPLSREKRKEARRENAAVGGLVGGLLGAVLGPWGAVTGAAVGARIGYKHKPD